MRLNSEKYTEMLHIFQSAVNNAPLSHCVSKEPITEFIGMKPYLQIKNFISTDTGTPVVVTEVEYERAINTGKIKDEMENMRP